MADDTTMSAAVGAGDKIRDLDDGTRKWPACASAYVTHVSNDDGATDPNVLALVTPDAGLPVQPANGATFAVTGTFWQATQPVSLASVPSHAVTNTGTFAVQAAQSGTWNVTNVSGTVSLPTGAATAAKQPALGTAGSASADVITVQGVASMTALKVDGSAVTQPVSGTFWQTTQPVSLVSVPSHAVTNAGTFAVQVSSALPAGANVIGHVIVDSGTVTTVSTVTAVTTVSTVTAVTSITNAVKVIGDAADGSAVAGSPLLCGAEANRARRSDVGADGDAVRLQADRYGRLKIAPGSDYAVAALQATASGDTTLIAAPGAGSRLKLARVEASNSHATTALTVGLKNTNVNSGSTFGKKYLPAAGGLAVWVFPLGDLDGGDNAAWTVNLSGAGQIEVTAYYELIAT